MLKIDLPPALIALMFVLFFGMVAAGYIWGRCPACDEVLRDWKPRHCPICGVDLGG